jgi:hypothetical protein
MNERIKLLAEQANLLGDWGEDITEGRYFVYDNLKNLEKFAELIVRECTKAVMDGTKEGDHYAQRIEQHFDNGTGGILHFGVEE